MNKRLTATALLISLTLATSLAAQQTPPLAELKQDAIAENERPVDHETDAEKHQSPRAEVREERTEHESQTGAAD